MLSWIGIQVLIYGFAMVSYYMIWKLCLHFQGFTASTHQGINRVGIMGVGDLMQSFVKIARDFILFFLEWNVLQHGVTVYSGLNLLFLMAFAVVIVVAACKSGVSKRALHLALLLLCLAALPVGCYLWHLTSPEVNYHGVMQQSVCLLYILAAVLFDRWMSPKISSLALVLFAAIVFNNSVNANMYYNYMHQCFEKTRSVAVELSTRIHLLDEGQIQYVAMYGALDDWDQEAYMPGGELGQLGGWKRMNRTILAPLFLSLYTDFDLNYYRVHDVEYPVVEQGGGIPAPQNWEFRFPMLDNEKTLALGQTPQVQEMPIWPARDCIQVFGNTVVVKLSDFTLDAES